MPVPLQDAERALRYVVSPVVAAGRHSEIPSNENPCKSGLRPRRDPMNEACPPMSGQRAAVAVPPPWLSWRGSGSILVIDDDDSIRTVVARSLAKLGFTVDQACDGQQAISKFESDPSLYALVMLDFKLPGMDGSEVASRLRDIKADVRIILMSGVTRQEALDEFTGQDATGFLQKPFALSGLVSELRAVLGA